MKRFQLLLIPIFAALVFFALRPGLALADDPTDLCINGVISDTTYSFEGASLPAEWIVGHEATMDAVAEDQGSNSVDDCEPTGIFDSTNYVKSRSCPWQPSGPNTYAVGVESTGLSISSPISGTLTHFNFTANNSLGTACYHNGEWKVISSGTIPAGWTCDGIWGGYAGSPSFERHILDVTITCGVGEYETASTCDLVDNADFTTQSDWILAGTSAITNGVLTLENLDYASQNLTGLSSNTTYNLVLEVPDTITTTNAVDIYLGPESVTFNDVTSGTLSAEFTTGLVSGPLTFKIQNVGGNYLEVDFVCLYLASQGPGGGQSVCIAPENGEFTTADNWSFDRNASWQAGDQTAKLPAATQGLVTTLGSFTVPNTITSSQYLILSFDAKNSGGNGYLSSRTNSLNADITTTLEIYQTFYNYQVDISAIPIVGDSTASLAFANPGIDGYAGIFNEHDASIDNVCIFVSSTPPILPQPSTPGTYTPVDLGGWYDCSDIESIVYSFIGVDLRYHYLNAQTTPSVWNPEDWVPWLISWFWVIVETTLCFLLVLIGTIINLVEYILNNGLNIFAWLRSNYQNLIPWAWEWLTSFDLSFENFLEFWRVTAENWLTWAALAVAEFATAENILVANWAVILLGITGGFGWLVFTQLPALFLWLITEGNNTLKALLNFLIDNMWNTGLRVSLGNLISTILDIFIAIWNSSLVPFLLQLLLGPFGGILSLISFIPLFWDLVWSVAMYLWVNVFQMINIPFAFYTGLSAGVQSTAFSDLLSCDGSTLNFWCNFLAAIDLLNGITGQSIFYPIVIVGIVIATIAILYRNIIGLWNFYADWLSRL